MDNAGNIKLFDTNPDAVILPDNSLSETEEIQGITSDELSDAITGDQVKTLLLKEELDIAVYNYVFDLSDIDTMQPIQIESLKSILSRDGTVQIYLYKKEKGLVSVGFGDKYRLERMVPLLKTYVFDNIRVYKDLKKGETPNEVIKRDITKLRLNL